MHKKAKQRRKQRKLEQKQTKVTHFTPDPLYKAKKKILDGHPLPLKRDLFPTSPGTEWSKLPIIISVVTKVLSYYTT